VSLILDGLVLLPARLPASGPVTAAADLLNPLQPASAEELAQRIGVLYEQHPRFFRLNPTLWMAHLNRLANAKLSVPPVELTDVLRTHCDAQWLIIDGLGLPFLKTLKQALPDDLPQWKVATLSFGQVSSQTSTDQFYGELLNREFKKPFIKINAIDTLLHTRKASFNELTQLALAELKIELKRVRQTLDPAQPLLLFGDHGFRLSPDGFSFTHGGPSTLERLALVCHLAPVR
jgi:hypothetical protein